VHYPTLFQQARHDGLWKKCAFECFSAIVEVMDIPQRITSLNPERKETPTHNALLIGT